MATAKYRTFQCVQCGFQLEQKTNHLTFTWSHGHFNTCPNCPPYAKYPEYGGITLWECQETGEMTTDELKVHVDHWEKEIAETIAKMHKIEPTHSKYAALYAALERRLSHATLKRNDWRLLYDASRTPEKAS